MNTKRLNSIRLNWFILGAIIGVVLSFLLNQLVTGSLQAAVMAHASQAPAGEESLLSAILPDSASEEAAAEPAAEPELATGPSQIDKQIEKGDTLLNILVDESVPYDEAVNVIAAIRKTYDPRDLKIGQELSLKLEPHADNPDEKILSGLSIELDQIRRVNLERLPGGQFFARKIEKELKPELKLAGGTIRNSLFETGHQSGIPNGVLAELVQAYSYDVDFQREIQRGDQLEVLFENMTTDEGHSAGYGKIFYAMLKIGDKPIKIYRYQDGDHVGFYNEKGESIVKALLKTPIEGARISSGYGPRRHPILGYTRMHQGTDFAAPIGTPIYAAGDGVVAFKGVKGGYGNYIQIKHNQTYSTAYGHISRFPRHIYNGKPVKQGEIVAYVGNTGRSTGPHLHYEVHKNGTQVNPLKEKFKTGKVLAGAQLDKFRRHVTSVNHQVAAMPRNTVVASSR